MTVREAARSGQASRVDRSTGTDRRIRLGARTPAIAGIGNKRLLPASAQLITSFAGSCSPDREHGLTLHVAWLLARHHDEQWAAEDTCRDRAADDHVVAAAKRAIDGMNAVRVAMVERIDGFVARHLRCPADAPVHTETFGSVVDRLAVAWVRARHLSVCGAGVAHRERGRRAALQLAELADAYDVLVHELLAGYRRVPFWSALKQYGSAS